MFKTERSYKEFQSHLVFLLNVYYSYHPRGEKPWDPVCLFRSYWLMCQYGDGGSKSCWLIRIIMRDAAIHANDWITTWFNYRAA